MPRPRMMQILSDLHLDVWNNRRAFDHLIADLQPEGCSTLIIAGDLGEYSFLIEQAHSVFECICDKYEEVIYVAGNHEYYGSNYERTQDRLKALDAKFSNLYCLENETFESKVGLVAGTTLWFSDGPYNRFYEKLMNDFRFIENFRDWVYEVNAKSIDFLANLAKTEQRKPDLVITHHLPCWKSVSAQYTHDRTNLYFLCDISGILLDMNPKVVVHGHSHIPCDYILGETRVTSNPRGYPGENRGNYEPRIIQL